MRKAKWSKLLCEIIFVGIKWKEIQNCLAFWKKEPNAKDKLQSYKEKVQKMKMKSPQKKKLQKIEKKQICWNLLKSRIWKQGFQQISTDFIFSNFGCFFFPCVFFFLWCFCLVFFWFSPVLCQFWFGNWCVLCFSLPCSFLVFVGFVFFVSLVLLLLLICCFVFFSGFAFSHTLVSDFAWLFSRSMFSCRTILAQSFVSATAIKH